MENKLKQVELTYSYRFPIAVVFEAWINPEYLPQWFAPHGCTIEFRKLDIREGGSYHSCIHTPHAGDCWCIGTYVEIVPMRKIVFTMINADENGIPMSYHDPEWPSETLVTVSFSEVNGKTIVTLNQTAPESIAKKTGAYTGWTQMLERMESIIEKQLI